MSHEVVGRTALMGIRMRRHGRSRFPSVLVRPLRDLSALESTMCGGLNLMIAKRPFKHLFPDAIGIQRFTGGRKPIVGGIVSDLSMFPDHLQAQGDFKIQVRWCPAYPVVSADHYMLRLAVLRQFEHIASAAGCDDRASACARCRGRGAFGRPPWAASGDCAERRTRPGMPAAGRGSPRDRYRSATAEGSRWRGQPAARRIWRPCATRVSAVA